MRKFNKFIFYFLLASLTFVGCNKDEESEPEQPRTPTTGEFRGVITEKVLHAIDIADAFCEQVPEMESNKQLLLLVLKDINYATIRYTTTGMDGTIVEASGVVAYCTTTKSYDHILSIQHGTTDIAEAPTLVGFPIELSPVMKGEVTIMADYLGYGVSQTSDLKHPYLHVELTGKTCADMIEAAEQYLATKQGLEKTGDGIKLMGYSQGGAATVATLLELEHRGMANRIVDVLAGGGPYNTITYLNTFTADPDMQYNRNGYIPFFIRGMICGEHLVVEDSNIYAPEVIENGYNLLFNSTQLTYWHTLLGLNVNEVLHPDFYAPDYNNNEDILKLIAAARKNSLVNYAMPSTPIQLYHSPLDNTVPYACSVELHERWSNTTLTDLESDQHFKGGIEFMAQYMGIWPLLKDFIKDLDFSK